MSAKKIKKSVKKAIKKKEPIEKDKLVHNEKPLKITGSLNKAFKDIFKKD